VEYLKEHNFKKIRLCDLQYQLNDLIEINTEEDLAKLRIKKYTKKDDKSFVITTMTDKSLMVNLKDKLIGLADGGYQVMLGSWKVIHAIEGMYTDEALKESGGVRGHQVASPANLLCCMYLEPIQLHQIFNHLFQQPWVLPRVEGGQCRQ
jgi:hypothetical protein